MGLDKPFKEFTLQWHITDVCEMNCQHCYIDSLKKEEISLNDFKLAFGNYIKFLKYYNLKGRIYFTGGDPLLHKNFWTFLDLAKQNSIIIAILGNYHNLNTENLRKLRKYNIYFFQLSLEGLKRTHEYIRGKNTFKKTREAIELLENNGIRTVVNMTISKQNVNEVTPLIKELSRTSASRFDFVRMVPIGKVKNQEKNLLSPKKFRDLLLEVLKMEKEIRRYNTKLQIGKKDHLWKLLYFENNKLKIPLNNLAYGCGMGYRHLTVLPDGSILLCRKLEKKIGNILNDDLILIYKNNKLIKKILENKLIKDCVACPLKNVCRGCPAVSYAIYKNFNKKDPQCWLKYNR